MKIQSVLPAGLMIMLFSAAFMTGSKVIFLIALIVLLTVLTGLASVLWASATISVSANIADHVVRRGDRTELIFQVRHSGWIPIAPIVVEIPSMSGGPSRKIQLKDNPRRIQSLRMPIEAVHVGIYSSGVNCCMIEDILGIFRRTVRPEGTIFELKVLPRTFPVEPLVMAPGDPGSDMMARATEDVNAPSDTRAYQPGDALKKIHWKLSMRKRELIVRKYDEPLMQDVLILPDCSVPSSAIASSQADVRDALLDTSASVFSDQMKTDHEIRMPLTGKKPAELERSIGTEIALEYLARVEFSDDDRFERVLMQESQRVRKVGCIAVISARLNYAMVDIMNRIHHTGPNIRMYYITFTPDDPNILPMISRLKQSGVEVAYVIPE